MRRQSKILNSDGELVRYEMDVPIRKKAEKAVLTALLDSSREDPEVYYTTTGIAKNTLESPNHYGIINNTDVPILFMDYVKRGIVSRVIIRKGCKGAKQYLAVVYSVNPKKFKELEKILKKL